LTSAVATVGERRHLVPCRRRDGPRSPCERTPPPAPLHPCGRRGPDPKSHQRHHRRARPPKKRGEFGGGGERGGGGRAAPSCRHRSPRRCYARITWSRSRARQTCLRWSSRAGSDGVAAPPAAAAAAPADARAAAARRRRPRSPRRHQRAARPPAPERPNRGPQGPLTTVNRQRRPRGLERAGGRGAGERAAPRQDEAPAPSVGRRTTLERPPSYNRSEVAAAALRGASSGTNADAAAAVPTAISAVAAAAATAAATAAAITATAAAAAAAAASAEAAAAPAPAAAAAAAAAIAAATAAVSAPSNHPLMGLARPHEGARGRTARIQRGDPGPPSVGDGGSRVGRAGSGCWSWGAPVRTSRRQRQPPISPSAPRPPALHDIPPARAEMQRRAPPRPP